MIEEHWDVIVIGSGMGGLTAASLLAQLRHRRVLVLERHWKAGGFTHTFSRKGFTWDTGLHYVGEMEPGEIFRDFIELVTQGGIKWNKMPSPYDRLIYPDMELALPAGEQNFINTIGGLFPNERPAIQQYVQDVKCTAKWFFRHCAGKLFPKSLAYLIEAPGRLLAVQSTKTYFDDHFRNPRLKTILASQWGDYGLPPSKSSFLIHSMIVNHYLNGGYYPEGGSSVIADRIESIIEAAGGAVRVNHEVIEICQHDRSVTGVKVQIGKGKRKMERVIHAPVVISDAGVYNTYARLLPASLQLPQQTLLPQIPQTASLVGLYLGFKESPTKLGFTGENVWVYAGADHEVCYTDCNKILQGEVTHMCIFFPTLKLQGGPSDRHSAEILLLAEYSAFQEWADKPWRNRGDAYESLKQRISNAILDFVEKRFPGFRDLICFQELSTPLSIESFTGHREGASYGIPATPERYQKGWFDVYSPIKGLILAGQDVASLGVCGAMMGGVMAAASQMGITGYPEITWRAKRFSATLSS